MFLTNLLIMGLLYFVCETAVSQDASKFIVREGEDEISGKAWRALVVMADDNESMLQLKVYKGSSPTLGISPKKTIFPDKNDVSTKRMQVGITLRSTAMDAPITQMWDMPWMDYKVAVGRFLPEQVEKIFGGESVTIQLDKVGARYRFITSGAGYENLGDELTKVLSYAPTPEEDKARVEALLKEHEEEKSLAQKPKRMKESSEESAEVVEARKEGEESGRSMRARTAGVASNLKEHEILGRAKSTADRKGFKKTSDPRRKAFLEGYMSQFPEFEPSR